MNRVLHNQEHWVHTWTAAPQLTEPDNLPPKPFTQDTVIFANTTIRETVRITLGTPTRLRLRLSNAFSSQPLPITEASIALAANGQSGTSAIQPGSLHQVTFSGNKTVTIASGAQVVSDPVEFGFVLPARTVLSVSLFLEDGQSRAAGITSHPGSRTTSYLTRGNHVGRMDLTDEFGAVEQVDHWYYISGIEVSSHQEARAIAIIGDSITDGKCSTTNGDTRWPDLLFSRIQEKQNQQSIAIVNQATGGNRILEDGLGPNVLERLDRDILCLSGVGCVMIFHGVNDIGVCPADSTAQERLAAQLIAAYHQIAMRVHARGIPIFAATITPFGRPTVSREGANLDEIDTKKADATRTTYSHPLREKTRKKFNDWLRASDVFDYIVDFDLVLRDAGDPSCLAKEFDSGDHLHPNEKAFRALADVFPPNVIIHES